MDPEPRASPDLARAAARGEQNMAKVFVANGKRHAKKSTENTHRRNYLPLIVGNPTQRRPQVMAKKKSQGLARRMRRNPGFIGESVGTLGKQVVGAAAGFLGDVYIPSTLLGMAGMPD